MQKLLITGASGFLGWHLAQQAQREWQVHGTARQIPQWTIDRSGITWHSLDLTAAADLRSLLLRLRPDAVIHAAAQANANLCQTEPAASSAINVAASLHLAEACAELAIPCVFTSTDLVFDGRHPPYCETDRPHPLNAYGEQKVTAEQGMGDRCPALIICRLPLLYGLAPHAQSFLAPLIDRLQSGQSVKLFVDEFRTPVDGSSAAAGILLALRQWRDRDSSQTGSRQATVLHLGGKTRLSRYAFGQQLVRSLRLSESLLIPASQAEVAMAAPRPADVSLDSTIAFGWGYAPPSIEAGLAPSQLHPPT